MLDARLETRVGDKMVLNEAKPSGGLSVFNFVALGPRQRGGQGRLSFCGIKAVGILRQRKEAVRIRVSNLGERLFGNGGVCFELSGDW